MTNEEFNQSVENGHQRSKNLLLSKQDEYAPDDGTDRLIQFKVAAALNQESEPEALWGMATKHITSLATMVKDPTLYDLTTWREKITDLRNYTHLLDGLIEEFHNAREISK